MRFYGIYSTILQENKDSGLGHGFGFLWISQNKAYDSFRETEKQGFFLKSRNSCTLQKRAEPNIFSKRETIGVSCPSHY